MVGRRVEWMGFPSPLKEDRGLRRKADAGNVRLDIGPVGLESARTGGRIERGRFERRLAGQEDRSLAGCRLYRRQVGWEASWVRRQITYNM